MQSFCNLGVGREFQFTLKGKGTGSSRGGAFKNLEHILKPPWGVYVCVWGNESAPVTTQLLSLSNVTFEGKGMALKVGARELQTRMCSRGGAGIAQTESAAVAVE